MQTIEEKAAWWRVYRLMPYADRMAMLNYLPPRQAPPCAAIVELWAVADECNARVERWIKKQQEVR
jgi:hypothetical protein